MDASIQTIAQYGSILPGNALGSTTVPNFLEPTKQVKVGEGTNQASWSSWIVDVANAGAKALINPMGAFMPSAGEIAKNSATASSNFVKRQVDKAVGAATGLGENVTGFFSGFRDSLKYLAWGLVAVAVIYVVAVIAPAITAGRKG